MCGIGGIIKLDISDFEVREIAEKLLLSLQSRGRDATGVYTNGKIIKSPIDASTFIEFGFLPDKFGEITLLHTRLATQGTPFMNENNHPLSGEKFVMVHNGIIYMERIATYPYKGFVDSEILLSYAEVFGVKEAIRNLQGTAAIAITKKKNPREVYLWRNTSPLAVGMIENKAIVFASEIDMLYNLVDRKLSYFPEIYATEIKRDRLYTISAETVKVEKLKSTKMYFSREWWY